MGHFEVVDARCRNEFFFRAEKACRRGVVEREVEVKNLLRVNFQLAGNEIEQVALAERERDCALTRQITRQILEEVAFLRES